MIVSQYVHKYLFGHRGCFDYRTYEPDQECKISTNDGSIRTMASSEDIDTFFLYNAHAGILVRKEYLLLQSGELVFIAYLWPVTSENYLYRELDENGQLLFSISCAGYRSSQILLSYLTTSGIKQQLVDIKLDGTAVFFSFKRIEDQIIYTIDNVGGMLDIIDTKSEYGRWGGNNKVPYDQGAPDVMDKYDNRAIYTWMKATVILGRTLPHGFPIQNIFDNYVGSSDIFDKIATRFCSYSSLAEYLNIGPDIDHRYYNNNNPYFLSLPLEQEVVDGTGRRPIEDFILPMCLRSIVSSKQNTELVMHMLYRDYLLMQKVSKLNSFAASITNRQYAHSYIFHLYRHLACRVDYETFQKYMPAPLWLEITTFLIEKIIPALQNSSAGGNHGAIIKTTTLLFLWCNKELVEISQIRRGVLDIFEHCKTSMLPDGSDVESTFHYNRVLLLSLRVLFFMAEDLISWNVITDDEFTEFHKIALYRQRFIWSLATNDQLPYLGNGAGDLKEYYYFEDRHWSVFENQNRLFPNKGMGIIYGKHTTLFYKGSKPDSKTVYDTCSFQLFDLALNQYVFPASFTKHNVVMIDNSYAYISAYEWYINSQNLNVFPSISKTENYHYVKLRTYQGFVKAREVNNIREILYYHNDDCIVLLDSFTETGHNGNVVYQIGNMIYTEHDDYITIGDYHIEFYQLHPFEKIKGNISDNSIFFPISSTRRYITVISRIIYKSINQILQDIQNVDAHNSNTFEWVDLGALKYTL